MGSLGGQKISTMFLQEHLSYIHVRTKWPKPLFFKDSHSLANEIHGAGHNHHGVRSRGAASSLEGRLRVGDRLNLSPGTARRLLNLFRGRRPWILGARNDHPVGPGKKDLG